MPKLWQWWKKTVDSWAEHHHALPKPWPLFQRSLVDYRRHWPTLVGVVAIVAVPAALLSVYAVSPTSDTSLAAYIAFAQLAMNVAVIYAVVELLHGRNPGVRQAYYVGSRMLIRLILLSFLLVLMGLLLIVGVLIVSFGIAGNGTELARGEQFLVLLAAVAIATPGVILLARSLWSVYVLFEMPAGPIEAIRVSRKLTRSKVAVTLGRLAALILMLALIMAVPAALLLALSNITGWTIFQALLQILAALIILPLSNFYLYRYYQALK